jgi:2,4-dienoyl-CoA reductase-like NADH-dependent reductase (Old Yellow Enzyme family)
MKLAEIKQLCRELVAEGQVDFLDISLWDYTKQVEGDHKGAKSLLEHFTEIDFGEVKWTVAGQIRTAHDVKKILESGVDFVSIGRAAILHHDFPSKVMGNPGFKPTELPVSREYLKGEGLSEPFIRYMDRWPDFVK